MHCDAFPSSLRTSLHPSALGLAARSAEARGPAPGPPLRSMAPQTPADCREAALAETSSRG